MMPPVPICSKTLTCEGVKYDMIGAATPRIVSYIYGVDIFFRHEPGQNKQDYYGNQSRHN